MCYGVLILLLLFWSVFIIGLWFLVVMGDVNILLYIFIVIFILGYFMFDFLWCFYMGIEGIDMFLYYIIFICGIVFVLFDGYFGLEFVVIIFGIEILNLFL